MQVVTSNSLLSKDALVEISFLLPDHGGRSSPVRSGYRPQFFYDNHDWDAQHEYIDKEIVHPGETTRAYLTFLSPQEHLGKLKNGDHFLIREGNKNIAFGHVIEIIQLEQHAMEVIRNSEKTATSRSI